MRQTSISTLAKIKHLHPNNIVKATSGIMFIFYCILSILIFVSLLMLCFCPSVILSIFKCIFNNMMKFTLQLMRLVDRKTTLIIIPRTQSSGPSFQPAFHLMNSHPVSLTQLKPSFVILLPPFNVRLLLLKPALFKKWYGTNQDHSVWILACPLILMAYRL